MRLIRGDFDVEILAAVGISVCALLIAVVCFDCVTDFAATQIMLRR